MTNKNLAYPNLPASCTIELEVRILQNGNLIRKGISTIESEGKDIDLHGAGLAIQRTSYELLKVIWNTSSEQVDF